MSNVLTRAIARVGAFVYSLNRESWIVLAATILPILWIMLIKAHEGRQEAQFNAYLAAQNCHQIGPTVARVGQENCDAMGCQSLEDQYTMEYFCPEQGEVTFEDFKDGYLK